MPTHAKRKENLMELLAGILIGALLGSAEFLAWTVAGAAGLLGLATVANVLELALDLETS